MEHVISKIMLILSPILWWWLYREIISFTNEYKKLKREEGETYEDA